MFFRNGILSDKQFMKHYGRDIFIYPFKRYNLKGSSYNLTASRVAYYKENGKLVSALVTREKIMIPPKKIIYIQTEESIYTTKRICGTYHSKVKWANMGLSALSTTLDPCYFGTSLISLMNFSDKKIELDVGESFCTLILHKITSGNKDAHDNVPFRKDISSGKIYDFSNMYDLIELKKKQEIEKINEKKQNIAEEEIKIYESLRTQKIKMKELEYKNYLEKWYEQDFRRSKDALIKIVKKEVREQNKEKSRAYISIGLVILYMLSFFAVAFIENVSGFFLSKEIDLKFSEKLTILTIAVPAFAFVHQIFVNLILRIEYGVSDFIYTIRN